MAEQLSVRWVGRPAGGRQPVRLATPLGEVVVDVLAERGVSYRLTCRAARASHSVTYRPVSLRRSDAG